MYGPTRAPLMKRRFSFRPFSTSPDNGGRMLLDEATWAEVRRLYCKEGVSQPMLALKFGISRSTISSRVRREGWTKGKPSASAQGTRKTYASLPSPKSRRSMIARLYRAISLKLEHMEQRMASGESRSAQDEERESRALGAMIRNFEKVAEVVAELEPSEGARPKDATAVSADAERMRREIAERLGRLATGRLDRGGAGEP
jgi:hypothetical protein